MGIEELETEITNRAETIDFRGTKLKVINVDLVLDLIDQWQTPISTDEGCDIPEETCVMEEPTQPELVEVPEFVADWYEEHRNDTLEAKFSRAKTDKDIRVQNWYNNCEGRHVNKRANAQEIIAKMTLCGYTVKKEQLYYVKLLPLGYLIKHKLGNNHAFINSYAIEDERLQAKFTEKEIKAIDERYWAFAVPVEEVGNNYG